MAKLNYQTGWEFAKGVFKKFLGTGKCGTVGSEAQFYCEAVVGVIGSNDLMTRSRIGLIKEIKESKDCLFYDGVCDFLMEEMEKYLIEQREKMPKGRDGVSKLLEKVGM